jgi:hypothetical protein
MVILIFAAPVKYERTFFRVNLESELPGVAPGSRFHLAGFAAIRQKAEG